MEGKLIKTEEGYYLVNDAEIKEDSYYLAWELNYRSPKWVRYVLGLGLNGIRQYNIVASNLDLEGVPKLSIENCQAIERGYDLGALGYDYYTNGGNNSVADAFHWSNGFQKAIEILGDKRFSEEDMITFAKYCLDNNDCFLNINNSLLKFQPNEWDVEIAWETDEPILDKNGFYILKRK